jgi:hypothetical protein
VASVIRLQVPRQAGWVEPVSIDVRPSEDAAKYLATDQLVWFGEVTDDDADLDLMGTTRLENVGVDDPILGWIGGPRGAGDLKTWDSTWVRTDSPAAVTLDVAALGAGYLGHGIGGLLRAGLVQQHRTGAYAELARAMRTSVAPEPSIGF